MTNSVSSNRSKKYNIAAFFSGVGGIELGFEQTNEFRVVYANENAKNLLDSFLRDFYFYFFLTTSLLLRQFWLLRFGCWRLVWRGYWSCNYGRCRLRGRAYPQFLGWTAPVQLHAEQRLLARSRDWDGSS